jgi:nucleoside-diphosphate-sugar epimerase
MRTSQARRILVTGGTGFVGKHATAALLADGWDVHVAARDGARRVAGAQFHVADLLDANSATPLLAASNPEAILHMAWCVTPGAFWTDPTNLDWVGATLRLARAAADAGVDHFIGVGTCYEYDWPEDSPCIEGVTPLAVHTLYDAAKASVASVLARFFADGPTRFAWGRLFHLYGPDESPSRFVASLARAFAREQPAKCSRGLVTRDFLDTRDAGAALAAVARARHAGPVNIGSGAGFTLADLARKLADLSGKPSLLRLGALPDRPGEPPTIVADTTILRREIGFAPRYDLETGLRDALSEARERASADAHV